MRVHLDHNATTPLRPEVRELLAASLAEDWGNASSVHARGRRARACVDAARERVAAALGVAEDEVLFTSGGSEANNQALFGVLRARGPGAGLVVSAIEHSSVLEAAAALERAGHPVARAPVDAQGRILLEDLALAARRPGTALVSVMGANNEIGVLAPLAALPDALGAPGERPLLHVDAVQMLGRVPVELDAWGAALASFSAHKVGGPLGVGVLVRRRGVALEPLVYGGGQEGGLRAGTENAPAIAAAALAIELAVAEREAQATRWRELASSFWGELRKQVADVRLLGPALDARDRLPNTLNLLFPGIDGRAFVARLDLEGLEASAGSACASGSLEPSHVLRAMGLCEDDARAGLRISFGRTTSADEAARAVDTLSRTVRALRKVR